MSKKARLIGLLVVALLVVAALPAHPSAAQDTITIDFWHGLTGPDGAFLEQMVNTYNETNEDNVFVQLNVYHWDVFFDRWVASVAAGNPPDVVIYHINELPQYAEQGVVVPVDDLIEEVGVDLSQYNETVQNMSSWKGQVYGIPLDIHPIGMYYNVDYVKAAGLDPEAPPTNKEELLAWAQAMTTDDYYGISAPATNVLTFRLWWGLIFQNEGTFISDDLSTITVDNPQAAEALQFLYDLVYKYEVAPEGQSDPDTDFQTGKVAITFQGPWWINGFAETEGLNFMTAPVPVVFKQPAVWASSHFFGFSNQDDRDSQLAAMKFAKWMAENGALWGLSGQIPAAESARESEEFMGSDIYQYQKAFVEELPYIVYTPPITKSTEVFAENVQTPLVIGWQSVMIDAMTPEEAVAQMQEGIQAVLDR